MLVQLDISFKIKRQVIEQSWKSREENVLLKLYSNVGMLKLQTFM